MTTVTRVIATCATAGLLTVVIAAQAPQQQPPAGGAAAPAQGAPAQGRPGGAAAGRGAPAGPPSFFITSVGKGDGANYGGVAGADAYCQQMAMAAGRGGVMWHAYLSTQGAGAVNARDRIGNGPWYNARGQMI